jgi:hypothetical protein
VFPVVYWEVFMAGCAVNEFGFGWHSYSSLLSCLAVVFDGLVVDSGVVFGKLPC